LTTKKGVILNIVLLLAAAELTAAKVPAPEYAANEIIVKFREPAAGLLHEKLELNSSSDGLSLSNGLDDLNAKYKLKSIMPLCKDFGKRQRKLDQLQAQGQSPLSRKQKHILRRLRRAPKDVKIPDLGAIYKIQFALAPGQSLQEALKAYRRNPEVEYAGLNYVVSICREPDDPLYPIQWSLHNTGQMYPEGGRYNHPPGTADSDIDAPEAWDIITTASPIVVAVLDTGVDYNHRDLVNNMWVNQAELNGTEGVDDDENGYDDDVYGYDFYNSDSDPKDDHGHGSHCSGIIAAEGDNGLDIAGVCWDANIMALKFLGSGGSGDLAGAIQAVYYAVQNGADVISNSWGGSLGFPTALEEAFDYAYSQGVVLVSSAGNNASNFLGYPAIFESVMAVAATNSNDEKASFSSYGDMVDIAAPGVDVLSLRASGTSGGTIYNAYTTVSSGTSMACPHVSGACAMLLSINQDMPVEEVRSILMDTTDPIAAGICASGRLNLSSAVRRIFGPNGAVRLDSDAYSCNDTIKISLFDSDLSSNITYPLPVSTSGGDFETLLLSETHIPGIFFGTIAAVSDVPVVEDGLVQVSHGGLISVTYDDANDGTGNPATVTETAIIDCQEPVIFNLWIDGAGPVPKVHFETDEPATSRVLYSQDCTEPEPSVAEDTTLAVSHIIELSGVAPDTDYFLILEAADAAGNEAIDDNAGDCYQFTTDGPGDIYVPQQYQTIQEAIDRSWDGGTVQVADGNYTGEGNRDIDFRGKAITVRSISGPENCIIDCNGTKQDPHRGFYLFSGEDEHSVIAGFTITNGYAFGLTYNDRSGGAIRCDFSNPTITDCIFAENYGDWNAGGILNYYCSPFINNCIFINNSAVENDGGAINNDDSSPTITNSIFIGNSAYDWGGAVRNIFYCEPVIKNCTFVGNTADDGGAMFYYTECKPVISNCTFAENSARNGNALACTSYAEWYPSNIELISCILADGGEEISNQDDSDIQIRYSNVQGGYGGDGNIDADPCFVKPGVWVDANQPDNCVEPNDPNALWLPGDYHLLPTSPCINAGDPNYIPEPNEKDIDGESRVWQGRVDMGADEFVPPIPASLKITPQAFNPAGKGKWIKAHLVLPAAFTTEDVDADRPAELQPPRINSSYINVFVNTDGLVEIEAGFEREKFSDFTELGSVELTVKGFLTTGQPFRGSDEIRIIGPGLHWLEGFVAGWLQDDCAAPDWCSGFDFDRDSVVDFTDYAFLEDFCSEEDQ